MIIGHERDAGIRGTISDRTFQTSLFFPNPRFCCIFRENHTIITCVYNNFLRNSIFLERETILCCWELIITGNNEFKPVFLLRNHLNLDFMKFNVYFHLASIWVSNT